jgi:ankyrin repeat protein
VLLRLSFESSFALCAHKSHDQYVCKTFTHYTTARQTDGTTALIEAAQCDRADAIAALLEGGADIDTADDEGATALLAAAQYGSTATLRLLINADANLETCDKVGPIAHVASVNHHLPIQSNTH